MTLKGKIWRGSNNKPFLTMQKQEFSLGMMVTGIYSNLRMNELRPRV